MKINPYIFRNYDIRGIAGVDLDCEKVEAIGKAYGTFLRRRKIRQAVIGHDCRLSSEEYNSAFTKGMLAMGIDVIDLGMVMTQMSYFGQYRFQTNGGVMITASHNPWNYNGFKLATGFSRNTEIEDVQEIRRITGDETFFKSEEQGAVTKLEGSKREEFLEDYARDVLKRVRLKKKFKVVVDAWRGTTGLFNPKIFERAGCEVIGKNLEPDGHFPIGTPDPTATVVMERVRDEVLKEGADFGVAFDGDGDRVGIVDEKGNILWNDVLVAIFAKEILERFPKSKIIHNTLCSQLTSKVIEENGGVPIMWRVGYPFIKAKIAEEHAVFGGELSGHFFFADNAYGYDDGTYAVLRVLEYLSDKNVSLSQLYEGFPKYISSPEIKIGCPDEKKVEVIRDLSVKFKNDFPQAKITDAAVIPDDDGTRADFDDGMMIFRYSQNGPYITVKFEARDQKTYDERKKYARTLLESYPEMIWKDELAVNLSSLD
ncbi:MAG: phosphomannomutase/phosphoglucomutase [Candidatus Liptonbacteria bacterium]|nr:phosphomannomutase/phosphoglucomutase [Candidatus Liptonbacteria bacterium]